MQLLLSKIWPSVRSKNIMFKRPVLPDNAKQVFKGVIFDVYQWEQTMFDGSTKTFEMIVRPDSAMVIAVVGDKIYAQNEEQPGDLFFTSIPGGRVDEGETPLEAAKRELEEETGMTSESWDKLMEISPSPKTVYSAHYFIARDCKSGGRTHDDGGGEKITSRWITFDEFLELPYIDNFYEHGIFSEYLLKCKLDPVMKEELRKKIFGI